MNGTEKVGGEIKKQDQVVVFELNGQLYAIPVLKVKEITRMLKITRVPNSEFYVEGITNLRGSLISVINLAKRLGLQEKGYDDNTRVIVLETGENESGIIVDSVKEVSTVDAEEVESLKNTGQETKFLNGVIKRGDNIWLLLDVNEILC